MLFMDQQFMFIAYSVWFLIGRILCTTKWDPCQSSPCKNGRCKNVTHVHHGYICECPDEYTGINCEDYRCKSSGSSLYFGGLCYSCVDIMESWDTARTACQRFSGDLVSITSQSIQTFLESTCTKAVYWIGLNDKRTEGHFVWLDNSLVSVYTNWVTGEPNDAGGGEDCTQAHLHADGKWNDINCSSQAYYICDYITDADECLSSPCLHGSCVDLYNGFTCFCYQGYNGSLCEIDIDECLSSPCSNGTCVDRINTYHCICPPGYTGINCEIDIDECASSPCMHGTCVDQINSYYCICTSGFTGIHCKIDIDECISSPCQHGTCVDQINSYHCICSPGYTGINCEIDVNECLSFPCFNGQCLDLVNAFACECDFGYDGQFCENFNYQVLLILLSLLPILLGILSLLTISRCKKDSDVEDDWGIFAFPDVSHGQPKPKVTHKFY